MWEFLQQNVFPFLSGGLAGAILNQYFTHLRREKKILGYNINSRKIVERGHPELDIRYRGQLIDRLYSYQVIIRNIGNSAFTNLPVQILCNSGKFVEPTEVNERKGEDYVFDKFRLLSTEDAQ